MVKASLDRQLVQVPERVCTGRVFQLFGTSIAARSGILIGAFGDENPVVQVDHAVAGVDVEGKTRTRIHIKLIHSRMGHVEGITGVQGNIQAVLWCDRPVHLGFQIGPKNKIALGIL